VLTWSHHPQRLFINNPSLEGSRKKIFVLFSIVECLPTLALKPFRLYNPVKGQISKVCEENYFQKQKNVGAYERMAESNVM